VKYFSETLQRDSRATSALCAASRTAALRLERAEQAMKKTLITGIVALGLGVLGSPAFASGYTVNGHVASSAEMQLLASYGAGPGNWVVDGYGISPAVQKAAASTDAGSGQKCYYVLDVLLCD
jgi:hypothetical protein